MKGLQLTGGTDETAFDLTAPNGKTTRRVITSVAGADADSLVLVTVKNNMLSKMKKGNYWDSYDARAGTLYLNFDNCQDDEGTRLQRLMMHSLL